MTVLIDTDLGGWDERIKKAISMLTGRGIGDLMNLVALGAYSAIDRNFIFGGRPSRWAPLSPRTIAGRRKGGRHGFGAQILQDTGILKMSVTGSRRGTRARGTIKIVRGKMLMLGSNLIYARAQQFGLPRRRGQFWTKGGKPYYRMLPAVPARPFLVIPPEEVKDIERMATQYVLTALLGETPTYNPGAGQ